MNPDRIKIKHLQNHYVVDLDDGGDYLKEFSITEFGEKVAWQLAATYREGYLDARKETESLEEANSQMVQDISRGLNQA